MAPQIHRPAQRCKLCGPSGALPGTPTAGTIGPAVLIEREVQWLWIA